MFNKEFEDLETTEQLETVLIVEKEMEK